MQGSRQQWRAIGASKAKLYPASALPVIIPYTTLQALSRRKELSGTVHDTKEKCERHAHMVLGMHSRAATEKPIQSMAVEYLRVAPCLH